MNSAASSPLSGASRSFARSLARAAAFGLAMIVAAPAMAGPASVEPEESTLTTLPSPKPSWVFLQRGVALPGTTVFDTSTGKYVAQIETPILGDLAIDPAGKHYYVAETVWTRRLHGTRQNFISVYDAHTLTLEGDIDIPGRILVGNRERDFVVSDDGKTGYVYDFSPISSINVIDLVKRKFVKNVELPGCADLIPNQGVGVVSLCSDGSLASVNLTGDKADITRTDPFFNATGDPVFDDVQFDRTKAEAVMLSYSGLVYTAKLGAKPVVSAPFSIQEAAGLRKGETRPLDLNWYPTGHQPSALHRASGHLYVLMHAGEFWSHKDNATEIWDLDLAARKVVKRIAVDGGPNVINVTQEPEPKLVVLSDGDGGNTGYALPGTAQVIDPATWTVKFNLRDSGSGLIQVMQ